MYSQSGSGRSGSFGVVSSGNSFRYSSSSLSPSGSGQDSLAAAARRRYSPTVLLDILQARAMARFDKPASSLNPELDDERRRYYGLTDFGSRVLAAEAARIAQAMAVIQGKHILDRV